MSIDPNPKIIIDPGFGANPGGAAGPTLRIELADTSQVDQAELTIAIIEALQYYDAKPTVTLDRTGVGLELWEILKRRASAAVLDCFEEPS